MNSDQGSNTALVFANKLMSFFLEFWIHNQIIKQKLYNFVKLSWRIKNLYDIIPFMENISGCCFDVFLEVMMLKVVQFVGSYSISVTALFDIKLPYVKQCAG